MIPVILSGGSGSRLWPLSRQTCPKQFLALHTENTLFQETLMRLQNLKLSAPIVVCNIEHRFTVANNVQEIGATTHDIILEPMGRNTAPAIAAAAFSALAKEEDPVLLVLPADHEIANEQALGEAYQRANELAQEGYLVTFGIAPTTPHTGYGYIQLGDALGDGANQIAQFIEKPNEEKAQSLLDQGDCLWNSGMFCFKASRYLEELGKSSPELLSNARDAFEKADKDYDFLRLNGESFQECENISIDYAVMERTDKGCVVPINAQWTDIGSWDAVWSVFDKDENNNVLRGDIIEHNSKDSMIYSADKLTAVLGAKDLIIINLPDALLVAHKDHVQDVKLVVDQLKQDKREEVVNHQKVDRPWGSFTTLHDRKSAQVKRLSIKPDAEIGLQKHSHRAEHWVILRGQALVTKGFDNFNLSDNDSIHINPNEEHAIKNVGEGPLDVIEVRTGDYLEEDDVIRINKR